MRKPIEQLYVEIFDWPDRFLVECDGPDSDYPRVFPGLEDYLPEAPYLVDLSEFSLGWCGCTDFRIHILPNAERGATSGYLECKHILAARDFRRRMGKNPKVGIKLRFLDEDSKAGEISENDSGIVNDNADPSSDSLPG